MILDILNLAKKINNYIKQNSNNYVQRNKKTNIFDSVLFGLLMTKNGSTQSNAASDINTHTKKDCFRTSYSNRYKKLNIEFYRGINNIIDDLYKQKNKDTKQIVAVDGTYINILNNIDNFNIKDNKNQQTITPLISGIYNVTYKLPESLDIVTHKNEIKAFTDEYMVKNLSKNCIYVFDRGYQSDAFIKTMQESKVKYVCRIRKNSKYITDGLVDKTININVNNSNFSIRVITYSINEIPYYIITNLMDKNEYSVDIIKQIYHNRWDVEEYFKYVKRYHNIENINHSTFLEISKSMYCTLIVSKIVYILANLKESRTINMKANKSKIVNGFYNEFIYKFIYLKGFNYKFLQNFMRLNVELNKIRKNRHHLRICKRNNKKWYIKQYLHKKSTVKYNKNKIVKNITETKIIKNIEKQIGLLTNIMTDMIDSINKKI